MSSLPSVLEPSDAPGTLPEDEVSETWHSLTSLQQNWLLEFLTNGLNAAQAARDAGYEMNGDKSMPTTQGYQNRHHPKISKLIEHAGRRHMGEREALLRLSSQGRATWADFISFRDDGSVKIDLKKAERRGVLHHIKSMQQGTRERRDGSEETYIKNLTLRDPIKANIEILKLLGAYDDKEQEPTGDVTFNTWINGLREELSTEDEEEVWPEVDGAPQEKPSHLQEPVDLND